MFEKRLEVRISNPALIESAKELLNESRNYPDETNILRIYQIRQWMASGYISCAEIETDEKELHRLEKLGYESMARFILDRARSSPWPISSLSIRDWLEYPHGKYFDYSEVGTTKMEVTVMMVRAQIMENVWGHK